LVIDLNTTQEKAKTNADAKGMFMIEKIESFA
jgi:hypothetical protein